MAEIDEKKLYSKFVERMKDLTDNGDEELVLDALSHGKNTYLRMDRLESSDFDLSWIKKIEEVLFDLGDIIKAPRLTTKQVADLTPVELARKTTSESIQHLASHTQYVKEVDDYGNVIPSKVLNIANEDEIFTYENRFIATFIRKLMLFIEKRYEFAKKFATLHDEEVLFMKNKSRLGQTDIEIETKVRVSTATESLMAQKHNEAFARIEEIRRYVTYYYGSPFMKAFKTDHNVRNPIIKTNILRKNVKYKHCYDIYRYIEGYTRLGVRFHVDERYNELTPQELARLNYSLFSSYLAVQGAPKSVHGKIVSKDYKPRILQSMDDESFAYGEYLKGPISFVRIDEGYRAYLESLRCKDLPEHPSQGEREYYAEEYQHGRDLKRFDHEVEALLKRKQRELEKFELHAKQIVEERELARIRLKEAQEEISARQEEDMLNRVRAEIVRAARADFDFRYEGFDQAGQRPFIPEQDERPNDVRPSFVPQQGDFNVDSVPRLNRQADVIEPDIIPQIGGQTVFVPVPQQAQNPAEGLSTPPAERLSFREIYDRCEPELKEAYWAIRRHALSYGLRSRISNATDTYRLSGEHRGTYLKLTIVGKTIKAYYHLDPTGYDGGPIPHEDVSSMKAYVDVPFLFRVRSELSVRRALQLIDDMFEPLGIERVEVGEEELALPQEDTEQRIPPKPLDIPDAAAFPILEEDEEAPEPLPVAEPEPIIAPAPEAPAQEPAPIEEPQGGEEAPASLSLDSYERLPFLTKIKNADESLRDAYMEIRREALSYGLHSRFSMSADTYKLTGEHRGVYLKLTLVGKTIKAYYRLDPKAYDGTTIPHEDASNKKAYAEVPMLFRVRSGLSLRRAIALLDDMMTPLGIEKRIVPADELALPESDENLEIKPTPIVNEPEEAVPSEMETIVPQETEQPQEPVSSLNIVEGERLPFSAKLERAEQSLKDAYMTMRKEALSYGLRSRISNGGDTYKLNGELRGVYLKLNIVGKTLRAYYRLDPNAYIGSTIPFEDVSSKKTYSEIPFLFRIRSGLALRRAIKLLDDMLTPLGIEKRVVRDEDVALPVYEEPAPIAKPIVEEEPAFVETAEPVIEPEELPSATQPELVIDDGDLPIIDTPEPSIEEEPASVIAPEPEEQEAPTGFAALANIQRQSFEEKFEQADEDIKDAYRQIKEAALGYGLRSRISNFGDTFKLAGAHKGIYLKLNIVGKTLRVYYRLNPSDYEGTTLPFEDVSGKKMYAETPLLVRVRSGLSLRRALKLVDDMMTSVLGEDK